MLCFSFQELRVEWYHLENLGGYKTFIKATYSVDSGIESNLFWLAAYVWERKDEILTKIWVLVKNKTEDKQAKDLWSILAGD